MATPAEAPWMGKRVRPSETPAGKAQKRVRTAEDEEALDRALQESHAAARTRMTSTKPQTLKEVAASLYDGGGMTRKESEELARELLQSEKTTASVDSKSSLAASEATGSVGPEPRELDVRTSLPVASEATQETVTEGATAATQELVTEGVTRAAQPLDAKPDLRQFLLKTNQGGHESHELPPAHAVSICSSVLQTHVERVAAPPTAKFPEPDEALSSLSEGESQHENGQAARTKDQTAPYNIQDDQLAVQSGHAPADPKTSARQLVADMFGVCPDVTHLPGKPREEITVTAGASSEA